MSRTIQTGFEESPFWQQVITLLPEFADSYERSTEYPLFAEDVRPFSPKGFESFFLKTFRRNCLSNKNWPDAPDEGWIIPDRWFEQIKDIVRTLFVVKYLDGVEYLARKVQEIAEDHSLKTDFQFEAKPEGYYAAHLYILYPLQIPGIEWDTESRPIWIELQITTQLQEVIRALLHLHYEQNRAIEREDSAIRWEWDYRSDEFAANYLGHILHYIEGMIMEVRQRQKEHR